MRSISMQQPCQVSYKESLFLSRKPGKGAGRFARTLDWSPAHGDGAASSMTVQERTKLHAELLKNQHSYLPYAAFGLAKRQRAT